MTGPRVPLTLVAVLLALAAPGCGNDTKLIGALAQIDAARRSDPLFRIFPPRQASATCWIPEPRMPPPMRVLTTPMRGATPPPPPPRLRATCTTALDHTRPPGKPYVMVVFTERWSEYENETQKCTWEVLLGSTGKVITTHFRGDPPPQYWVA